MAHTAQRATLQADQLRRIQAALRERGLDGWLLYDYHATNPIAGRVLGLPHPMTRRYFALIPADGRPAVLAHKLERAPFSEWPGTVRVYFAWGELEGALSEMLTPGSRIAIESSGMDRVPQVDRVPVGVVELIESAGVHPVESSDLVTLFASAWSPAELESHRRSADVLAKTADVALRRAAASASGGDGLSEWDVKLDILERLGSAGLVDTDTIVAVGPNSANGHYETTEAAARGIEPDSVLMIDLWGREPGSVFADQTWMGFLGERIPEDVATVWNVVRSARDAAVELVKARWQDSERPLRGCDIDAVSRRLIEEAGFGEQFIHRTGHSIDGELHGLGPNIDSVETLDERRLFPGVGFSIEPGIYLEGRFGIRSEINVHLGTDGPEVTTPAPQEALPALLHESWLSPSAR